MKLRASFLTIVVLALTFALASVVTKKAYSQTRATPASPVIADLAWMSGDWQTATKGQVQVDEHWTLPAGGTMLGVSRTIVDDKTAEFEYLRIEQRGEDIFYVASPQGRSATDFKLTRLAGQEAVFENPAHDFPKRIIYRKSVNGLVASIDAGEKTKSQTFSYLPFRK